MMDEKIRKRLKRDYHKEPLQKRECPLKHDVELLYIKLNLTAEETGEYLGGMKAKNVRYYIKKYGLAKTMEQKQECIQKVVFQKYGVKTYSQLPKCKEKIKQTSLEHYGVTHPNKCREVREKIEKTNLEKYGFTVSTKSPIVKEHYKQTCRERYGCDAHTQAAGFQERVQQICLERYNSRFYARTDAFKEKAIETNMKKYGVPWAMMSSEVLDKRKQTCLEKWGTDNISTKHIGTEMLAFINNPEKLLSYVKSFDKPDYTYIAETLGISYDGLKKKLQEFNFWDNLEHGITHAETELALLFPSFSKSRKVISPYELDLYDDKYKLGIEFNGSYWHSDKFKEHDYHQMKSLRASEKGLFIYHIFEYEWETPILRDIIMSDLRKLIGEYQQKLDVNQCTVKEIDEHTCQIFLEKNHIKGYEKADIMLGLFEKELVSVLTIQNNTISRYCNALGIQADSFKPLFSFYLNKYNPDKVAVNLDLGKEQSNVYLQNGFIFKGYTEPKAYWIKHIYPLSEEEILDNLSEGTNEKEEDYLHSRGLHRLYDAGGLVLVWEKH